MIETKKWGVIEATMFTGAVLTKAGGLAQPPP